MHAPDVAVQRPGNRDAAVHVGHVRAAVQRMAGTVQLVRHVVRGPVTGAGLDELPDRVQVPGRFLREDVEQHRVHLQPGVLLLRGRRGRREREFRGVRIALGEGRGARRDQRDVGAGRGPDLEFLDQLRHDLGRFRNERDHRRRTRERAVYQPVQQVLQVPAEFADALRADHAAAALQRVERAPHRDQRLHVVGVLDPLRQVAANRRDLFLGLLDEQLEQLGIEMLRVFRHDRRVAHDCRGLVPGSVGHGRRLG